jgi:subtilisin family serine protease
MSHHRWFFRFILAGACAAVLAAGVFLIPAAAQSGGPTAEVDQAVLTAIDSQGSSDYIILVGEQADLSAAYAIEDWDARGEYVVTALSEAAQNSQAEILAALDQSGQKYQSFISVNAIYVFGGTRSGINSVQSLPGVARIVAPQDRPLAEGSIVQSWAMRAPTVVVNKDPDPDAEIYPTWGISFSHVQQMWDEYATTGQGIIVANLDTGVDYTHPALNSNYRCKANPGSAACWYDPFEEYSIPTDDHWHGTHTMGTMVAIDNQSLRVGMAPGATWIACNACENYYGYGYCPDLALLYCADWALHPGGSAANRPNVINNSWGGSYEGDDWYRSAVQSWRASGIFPVFSAGNDGEYGCATIGSPADYPESFTVAALSNAGVHDAVASFSSVGPTSAFSQPYTKPNLTAPGDDVYSTVPNSGYDYSDGTSMAAPHVAGAVALLWSCNSALKGNIDRTFNILQQSAFPMPLDDSCGQASKLNTSLFSGYGALDVLAAAGNACGSKALSGTITDPVTQRGLNGVLVEAMSGNIVYARTRTNGIGQYSFALPAGTYAISYSLAGYRTRALTFNTSTSSSYFSAALQRDCGNDLAEPFQAGQLPAGWLAETPANGQITIPDAGDTPLFDGNQGAYLTLTSTGASAGLSVSTPMLDFSNQSSVWLRFDQDLLAATGSTTVKVWAVINHGDTAYQVFSATTSSSGEVWVDVSDAVANQADVIFTFDFYATATGNHWLIDNVEIGSFNDDSTCGYADYFIFGPVVRR